MTEYQQGVYAGLQVGAPAVARLYKAICEHPGDHQGSVALKVDMPPNRALPRIMQLEEIGAVRTEKKKDGSHTKRLCWALEGPSAS